MRAIKAREQGGAKSKEQRAGGRKLETPRVSVIGYPFSVIRWTKGRITGPVAVGSRLLPGRQEADTPSGRTTLYIFSGARRIRSNGRGHERLFWSRVFS